MDSEKPLLSENIGLMILQELKYIRTEIKHEIITLGNHIKNLNENANIAKGYKSNVRRNIVKKSNLTHPVSDTFNLLSKTQEQLDILAEAGKSISLINFGESGEKMTEYTEIIEEDAEVIDAIEMEDDQNASFSAEIVPHDPNQNIELSDQALEIQKLPDSLDVHNALNCSICGRLLQNFECLMRHFRRNHKLSPKIKCCYCNKLFSGGLMLRKHLLNYHFNVDFGEIDLAAFICLEDDELAIANLIEERQLPGMLAEIKSQQTSLTKKPRRIPLCDVCGEEFRTKVALKKHRSAHSSEKFKCQICQRDFNSKTLLRSHIKIHQAGQHTHYDCPLCKNVYFYTKNRLVNHIAVMHPSFDLESQDTDQVTVSVNLDSLDNQF